MSGSQTEIHFLNLWLWHTNCYSLLLQKCSLVIDVAYNVKVITLGEHLETLVSSLLYSPASIDYKTYSKIIWSKPKW